jgi:L-lactate dehydrogenase complex protein LldF
MKHPEAAARFVEDSDRTSWHDDTLWHVRKRRDVAVYRVPEFQQLRETASAIKDHTLSHLEEYLISFEKKAIANGVQVHWAKDANDHNAIIEGIIKNSGGRAVVKSKSMLTEECHLNSHLIRKGYEVIDTDLGERIIQLRGEPPSHIVLPAIHLKKEDVGELFHKHLGTPKNESDPEHLVQAARVHLRQKFLKADVAITGANFAVAETGGIVVCTNEGNADLGVHCARIHIASVGIEKLIPEWKHIGVFTRLLARSATGQPITVYTSHFAKPREGAEMHIVLVDNGRTNQLARPDFRNSLKCIRCGACMNTCPVYRRSGGHSYHATVPGPIGAILSPNIDLKEYSDLPFASTLCGSCTDVCPVKIDIHQQLYKWRQVIGKSSALPWQKRVAIKFMGTILGKPTYYQFTGKLMRCLLVVIPKSWLNFGPLNSWTKERDIPKPPKESFTDWYKKQENGNT